MAAPASQLQHSTRSLSAIDILDRLDAQERGELFALGTHRQYQQEDVVCSKGDPGSQLFVLLSGQLKVVTSAVDGKHVTLAIMEPGELFGEIAALDGALRTATVVAIEPSELLCIARREFLSFLRHHPAAVVKVLTGMAAKMRRLSELVDDALFLDLPHRLARKLLSLAEHHGVQVEGRVRIELRLSQRELGELVGASRESINKQLGDWRARGILRTADCHLELQRVDQLRALADPLSENGSDPAR